jgi:hypothetical protein
MPVRRAFPPPTQFDATLQASDDATNYRPVAMLAASRADQRTVSFAPVKARWFRVVFEAGKPFTRSVAEGVGNHAISAAAGVIARHRGVVAGPAHAHQSIRRESGIRRGA